MYKALYFISFLLVFLLSNSSFGQRLIVTQLKRGIHNKYWEQASSNSIEFQFLKNIKTEDMFFRRTRNGINITGYVRDMEQNGVQEIPGLLIENFIWFYEDVKVKKWRRYKVSLTWYRNEKTFELTMYPIDFVDDNYIPDNSIEYFKGYSI